MFKRNHYGTHWIFAQIMEVHTTVSSERNLAQKIHRIKPKIKVVQSCSESVL